MADSVDTTIAPAILDGVRDEREHKPVVLPSLSYDRAAIMRYAWAEFRGPFNKRGTRSFKPFGHFLTMAWRVARNVRARMADGSIERERAERAASETLRQQLWAWEALMDQPCETLEAVRSKAAYLQNCPRSKGFAWEDGHVDALLASFAGGAHG